MLYFIPHWFLLLSSPCTQPSLSIDISSVFSLSIRLPVPLREVISILLYRCSINRPSLAYQQPCFLMRASFSGAVRSHTQATPSIPLATCNRGSNEPTTTSGRPQGFMRALRHTYTYYRWRALCPLPTHNSSRDGVLLQRFSTIGFRVICG